MTIQFNKSRLLASSLALSVLVHIFFLYAWRMCGTYNFTAPINQPPPIVVDLANLSDTIPPPPNPENPENNNLNSIEEDIVSDDNSSPANVNDIKPVQADPGQHLPKPETASVKAPQQVQADPNPTPLSPSSEFLTAKSETLIYLISMLGLPVGSAVLESKIENGEVWITLRVKSNTAISSVYPVDDFVETRHIEGRFIMSKIIQQEGTFKSDEDLTINLIKKRVSWVDNIRNHNIKVMIPTDKVLDTLSGIYYLRNRQLQIGRTEILHIFDSETYAEMPVEILRRETIRLPNLKMIDTLVVQPIMKAGGFLRQKGEILIWMSDDNYKVPVKIETTVALGRATIELLSAETKPLENEVIEKK